MTEKPVDCRPDRLPPTPQEVHWECPYTYRGGNVAKMSRGGLKRLAREQGIDLDGETKQERFTALMVHLQRRGWSPEQDLSKLAKS